MNHRLTYLAMFQTWKAWLTRRNDDVVADMDWGASVGRLNDPTRSQDHLMASNGHEPLKIATVLHFAKIHSGK